MISWHVALVIVTIVCFVGAALNVKAAFGLFTTAILGWFLFWLGL